MECLRLFLRRHFAGKSPVASRNVGCFIGLEERSTFCPTLRADKALTHALNDCLALSQLTSPSQGELKCLHGEKLAKLGG